LGSPFQKVKDTIIIKQCTQRPHIKNSILIIQLSSFLAGVLYYINQIFNIMIYGFKIRLLVKKRTYSMHYRWSYCENSRFQSSWHCLRNFSHIMDHLAMCCPPFKLPRCYCHFDFAFWHIVCWKDIYLIAPCLEADITGSTERKSDKN